MLSSPRQATTTARTPNAASPPPSIPPPQHVSRRGEREVGAARYYCPAFSARLAGAGAARHNRLRQHRASPHASRASARSLGQAFLLTELAAPAVDLWA